MQVCWHCVFDVHAPPTAAPPGPTPEQPCESSASATQSATDAGCPIRGTCHCRCTRPPCRRAPDSRAGRCRRRPRRWCWRCTRTEDRSNRCSRPDSSADRDRRRRGTCRCRSRRRARCSRSLADSTPARPCRTSRRRNRPRCTGSRSNSWCRSRRTPGRCHSRAGHSSRPRRRRYPRSTVDPLRRTVDT